MGPNAKKRERLWKENPHCFYCHSLTISPRDPTRRGKVKGKVATLEHLASRANPQRTNPYTNGYVLSCASCNKQRAKEDLRK